MKKFNYQIEIKVEVDAIATQLRSMFKDDSAHADVVVEQIIGRALSKDYDVLGKIMSAMNGFQKEIIAEVGVTYPVKTFRVYGYWTPKSIEENNSTYGDITEVTVIGINPYADEELEVEFLVPNKQGEMKPQTKWVSASQLTI